jgi:hypothetical protein
LRSRLCRDRSSRTESRPKNNRKPQCEKAMVADGRSATTPFAARLHAKHEPSQCGDPSEHRLRLAFQWCFDLLCDCTTKERMYLGRSTPSRNPPDEVFVHRRPRLQPRTCRRKTRKARYAPIRRRSVPDSVFSRCGSLVGRGRMWAVRDVVSLHSCLLWGLVVEVGVLAVLWRFF